MPRITLLASVLFACGRAIASEAEADPSTARPIEEARPTTPARGPGVGRWRSDEVCLELFANGDFELAVLGEGPKHLAMGRVEAGRDTLALHTSRIWRSRWIARCRRDHRAGGWSEGVEALGRTVAPGTTTSLSWTARGDSLELCAERCVVLTREARGFTGIWRAPDSDVGDEPLRALDVELVGDRHVVTVDRGTERARTSECTLHERGGDRFELACEPRADGEVARTMIVTRLPEQRARVCVERRCRELARVFDSYR